MAKHKRIVELTHKAKQADTQILIEALEFYTDILNRIEAWANEYPGADGIKEDHLRYTNEANIIKAELSNRGGRN